MFIFCFEHIKLLTLAIFILSAQVLSSQTDSTNNAAIDQVISIVSQVDETNNFIDQLIPENDVKLPFGIIKQYGTARYIIAIDSLKFEPKAAYFSAYAAIDFPGSLKKLAFRASHVKFNPKGVVGGDQSKLFLVSDHLIKINNTVSLKLKGGLHNYVEWDCTGFKGINLSGEFVFNTEYLIPDTSNVKDSKEVTASFNVYTTDINNLIAQVSITPFTLKGLKEWSFKVSKAIVDLSDLKNADGMVFPQGYNNPNILTPQMWKGFYLENFTIKLPKAISKTGTRTEVAATNLMIEHLGVSGIFQVNNLFNGKQGSMSGWDFSIDQLGIGFVCNQVNSGFLNGSLNIPIIDSTHSLNYHAGIFYNVNTKETDYTFSVNPKNNLRFNVFAANVNLNNNSSVAVTKINGYLKPTAVLNGNISFYTNKFSSGGSELQFQNICIQTNAPYITNGVFSFHNSNGAQTKVSNFPIQMNDITLGINQGSPVLGFSVSLNLSDNENNKLSVGTLILLKGKIETSQRTFNGDIPITFQKTNWKFDKVQIEGIDISLQTSPFQLNGHVLFKDDDPIYGDGFFGNISMLIPSVMSSPANVSVAFGSLPSYRYFYVDAKVPTSFLIPSTPITITSLIGGLYYHMKPNKSSEAEFINLKQNFPSASTNALSYIPTNTVSLGMKTGVGYKFSGNERAFNGDLMLEINFTSSGGLGTIKLSGDVYAITSISQRNSAPIKGKIEMLYDQPNHTFDALALVNINSYNAITGTGYFKIHFDPTVWYLCVGRPTNPNQINILNLVTAPSYFMVGNQIDPPMDLPEQIRNNPAITSIYGLRNNSQLQNAQGFCAGARISSSINKSFGFSFFNVQGYFNFDLGFDLMMNNYGENAHCQNSDQKIGMHGWLAEGNMYLAMNGGVNINGHLKFPANCPNTYQVCAGDVCVSKEMDCIIDKDFSFPVFNAAVAAVVTAKVPKPVYFAGVLNCHYDIFGKIDGNFNYDFSYGNNCDPISN